MIKKLPETNLNVVVRVVLETDNSKWKNSVMTFYRIRERNLKKLIEKNGVLYKKEQPVYNVHIVIMALPKELLKQRLCCYAPTGLKEMRDRAHPPIILWLSKYR